MKQHKINKKNNFIAGWYIDHEICDELIEYHKNSDEKFEGKIGRGIVKEVKDSTDVKLKDHELLLAYYGRIKNVAHEYIKKYPNSNEYSPWGIDEDMLIQHYKPGQGFLSWHTERSVLYWPVSARHLVFMTYLNTLTDGGETEWFHQNLKIKPEKGLTVIWPVDWTFTHRGVTSNTQEKYIATGWFSFAQPPNEYENSNVKQITADSVGADSV